jgi:uncharacterized protein (DUF2249 family)
MNSRTITLDVREDIRQGREPFSIIMKNVAAMQAGDQLRLLAPFEPVPLLRMLSSQGFQHTSQAIGSEDWEVIFTRQILSAGATKAAEVSNDARTTISSGKIVEVDARGLEPPQPMVAVLEALASLPPQAELRARTDRRPMHLYAQLDARGFVGQTEEQPDGSFITHISRR